MEDNQANSRQLINLINKFYDKDEDLTPNL